VSVEINSDKEQKGRVKTGKRLKEGNQNQAPEKIAFNFFSSFECFSSSSILFSFCYCLSHIALISDPDLWSVGEQILHSNGKYGMHLNIESSTDNVID